MAGILIADDDPDICEILRKALKKAGVEHIKIAQAGTKALELLATARFDVAILDIYMPGMNGLEVARAAKRKGIETDIIIMTGQATVDTAIEALHIDVQDYIRKPFMPKELVSIVLPLLEKRHSLPHTLVDQIDEFIKENSGNFSLKLSEVSRHFNINPDYVTRLLRQHLGMTFRRRLAWHRIQKAKCLLTSTECPLSAIAEKCGFKNQARLSETFIRMERIGPKGYRGLR
jgi:YesN/AraC family two-component response regulator